MKNAVSLFVIASATLLLLACIENTGKNADNKTRSADNFLELDNRLLHADSLVLVFYDNPYSEDSLRYSRFYKQVSLTADKVLIPFQDQLKAPVQLEEKRACRTEGKIWCFTKGKIFQTIYFSTKCDSCCYTYLIKDGNFYYGKPGEGFINWLNGIKPQAVSPPAR